MPKITAVEGALLIDIEDGDLVASEVFEKLRAKGHTIGLTPTAGRELVDVAIKDPYGSQEALRTIASWKHLGIKIFRLDPGNPYEDTEKGRVNYGIALEAAEDLIREGLFTDAQRNLARLICESAVAAATLLVLDDFSRETVKDTEVSAVLRKRHLDMPQISSWTDVLTSR